MNEHAPGEVGPAGTTAQECPPSHDTLAARGVVSTCSPLASQAGMRMLRAGGNAVDAAVAAAAVLTVVEPLTGTPGGDTFMQLWRPAEQRVRALNAGGAAPLGASAGHFRRLGGIPTDGMPASVVPGTVAGWARMLELWGTRSLAECLGDAHDIAQEGFAVGVRWSQALAQILPRLAAFPTSLAVFAAGGRAPAPGTVLRQPGLARSLRLISEDGPGAFYDGPIAEEICRFSTAQGGRHTVADFRRTRAEDLEPLTTSYRGFTITEQPLPSQGLILLIALNVLEHFDLAARGPGSAMAMHLGIEAVKLAFEDRLRYAGDPAFVDVPVDMLLSKEHAAELAGSIDPDRAGASAVPSWSAPDTTSLCTADADGAMVTYIQSLFSTNACVAGSTGILMNSRMLGFSLEDGSPNLLEPGKRPVHTLNTYTVLRDGRPFMVGGTPGAHFQVQTNLQVLTNVLDFGMGLQEAIDFPRWTIGDQLFLPQAAVNVESRFAAAALAELEARGHSLVREGAWASKGAVQAIRRDGDAYRAGTDRRRAGDTIAIW
ncbi:MAG: gamma-glutamyltransferase family protein [Chloroflexota bacterium]